MSLTHEEFGVGVQQVRQNAELSARVALSVVVEPMDSKLTPLIRELGAQRRGRGIPGGDLVRSARRRGARV